MYSAHCEFESSRTAAATANFVVLQAKATCTHDFKQL